MTCFFYRGVDFNKQKILETINVFFTKKTWESFSETTKNKIIDNIKVVCFEKGNRYNLLTDLEINSGLYFVYRGKIRVKTASNYELFNISKKEMFYIPTLSSVFMNKTNSSLSIETDEFTIAYILDRKIFSNLLFSSTYFRDYIEKVASRKIIRVYEYIMDKLYGKFLQNLSRYLIHHGVNNEVSLDNKTLCNELGVDETGLNILLERLIDQDIIKISNEKVTILNRESLLNSI